MTLEDRAARASQTLGIAAFCRAWRSARSRVGRSFPIGNADIRLWPLPDVTKTPPHRRGHDDFLATLRSWTNLGVVPDSGSSTGWKLEVGPFPGWAKVSGG
jgi:hypothetical protein